MIKRLLLNMLLCAAPVAVLAQTVDKVTNFTLDNGMDVVVIEDHRSPAVTHMVWYRSGSADEPVGQSGVAHYLEHLLFKGTKTRASGELSELVAANGGRDNAFTSYDYTAYYQRVAADRLPLMMELEADRMNNLVLTPEDIVTERNVILEECNQRTDNNPGALAQEQLRAAQYLNHRYGVPVIGWRHEMEALDMQDALDFYDKHYAPNNAILVVAGDVYPDEVRKLAEQYYGPIPREPALPERLRSQEPPQTAARRLVYEDPRVSQPYLIRSYLAPERDSGAQDKAAALVYLAELLGGSPFSSALGKALQFDLQIAVYTAANYNGDSLDDTMFTLVVAPSPDVTLAEAESELDRVLQNFLTGKIDDNQMESIRTRLRANEIYARDSIEGLANRYGAGLTQGLTIRDIQAWPDILNSVDAAAVQAVAGEVLDSKRSVTMYVQSVRQELTQ